LNIAKKSLEFTICIPTYNGSALIGETLKSILAQDFQNYKIIVSDDNSTDNTVGMVNNFGDPRIEVFKNKKNLGYGKNIEVLRQLAKGDILFLMGQDDLLLKGALSKTNSAFLLSEDIGAVTRPYYWFGGDKRKPVRAVRPYDNSKDSVISIFDGKKELEKTFESVGQLSGLAYRRKFMNVAFHEDIFPAHIYPFASILKSHPIVFLKDYTVAVRIDSSMTRHNSRIYYSSPTETWIKMFNAVYPEPKYENLRKQCVSFITGDFNGLIQLKTSGSMKLLVKEIVILVKYRPMNIINAKFWLFSLGTIIVPGELLRKLVDWFKKTVLSKTLIDIATEF
jgi:glycosyltransferase involved in cell wall biosynthesis